MVRMRLSETDEIAAELYLVPPARFVAARDQVVRQARAAGHRDLARELSALRRPTLSAWLVNALTRHQRARMQQLFALGRELRQAQTRLNGDLLRRLPAQREDLIAELLDWASRHAAEAGVQPTEAALSEVEATLHAGLVDLAAAATVMSGHLVRPMSHAGFGPLPQVDSAASPLAPSPLPNPGPAQDQLTEWSMWPVDDELRRRRENTDAASAHWQREHDLAEAEAALEAVKDRQEWLEQQRMQIRREKVSAEQDLAAARAAQRAALRAMIDARRALETAEERLQSPIEHPGAHNDPE